MAYDLLEERARTSASLPLRERRGAAGGAARRARPALLAVAEVRPAPTWEALAGRCGASHASASVEGLHAQAPRLPLPAPAGKRGDWWKWKIDPFTSTRCCSTRSRGTAGARPAHRLHVRASGTSGELVPVAKAYSGLSDGRSASWTAGSARTRVERFGPVRAVEPEPGLRAALRGHRRARTRHKSGVAVRFPRIARWRTDKPASEADTLATLRRMIVPAAS